MESRATGVRGPKSAPSRSSNGAVRAPSARRSIRPSRDRLSRPISTLAATSRLSNIDNSWCTKAMPAACAAATVRKGSAAPSIRIVPASGRTTPPNTRISVLFPAPFSPISPSTSPGPSAIDTSLSATTPG